MGERVSGEGVTSGTGGADSRSRVNAQHLPLPVIIDDGPQGETLTSAVGDGAKWPDF